MTQTVSRQKDQRLTHSGMSWQQFKLLEQSFAESPGIRLFYYKGEVEILAVSQDHETFSRLIGILLDRQFLSSSNLDYKVP